jgi:hypothetical protein
VKPDAPWCYSRPLAVVAGVVLVLVVLGCMSYSSYHLTEEDRATDVVKPAEGITPRPDGVTEQCGECRVAPHEALTVYYPVPFTSIPNLETHAKDDFFGNVRVAKLVKQEAASFEVKNPLSEVMLVRWSARGRLVPAPLPSALPPPIGPTVVVEVPK